MLKISDHTHGRSSLSPLFHCSILYHSGCFQIGFFSHLQRGGYTKDLSNVTIWLIELRWIWESSLAVLSTSPSGIAMRVMTQVRSRGWNSPIMMQRCGTAKEMIAAFMMEGSAQLSKQHWLLKSTVLFGECHVVKVYECTWFKISWVLQQMVYQ